MAIVERMTMQLFMMTLISNALLMDKLVLDFEFLK